MGLLGHTVTLFHYWTTSLPDCFPKGLHHFLEDRTAVDEGSDCSLTSPKLVVILGLFDYKSPPSGCELIAPCGSRLSFPDG